MDCHIGTLLLRIRVEHSRSLKDKRRVVRSMKERLRRRHNVSLAEVAGANSRQHCEILVATVSGSASRARMVLDQVRDVAIESLGRSLLDAEADVFPY